MIKLITYAYLKGETDIADNIEVKELDNCIKWAQDRLKFLLGTLFYNELYTQGTTSPTTYSTNNSSLYDPYIKQFLAWQAYEFYVSTQAQSYSSRGGYRVHIEENSEPASDGQMSTRVKMAKEQVQFYKGAMLNYIKQQQTISSANYPLYLGDPNNKKFGGSGITGVSKLDDSQTKIAKRVIYNGY